MSPVAAYVVQTLVTLLGVIALAVLLLYGARRLGIGRPSGPVSLVGRLPLDGRRVIYLIRVGETVYVVGASEAGLSKLGELPGDAVPAEPGVRSKFADALARSLAKGRDGDDPSSASKRGGADAA